MKEIARSEELEQRQGEIVDKYMEILSGERPEVIIINGEEFNQKAWLEKELQALDEEVNNCII